MANVAIITEAEIMRDLVLPNKADLTPDAARSILGLAFGREANREIRRLLKKNNQGRITAVERVTLERYLRVGQVLDLLHAKARLSLGHGEEVS